MKKRIYLSIALGILVLGLALVLLSAFGIVGADATDPSVEVGTAKTLFSYGVSMVVGAVALFALFAGI